MSSLYVQIGVIAVGVIALAGITWIIVTAENLKRAITGKGAAREITNQPLLVSPAVKYATSDECTQRHIPLEQRVNKVEERLDDIENKLHTTEQRIIEAGDQRAKGLHRRINCMLAGQNRILGRLGMPGISEDSEAL